MVDCASAGGGRGCRAKKKKKTNGEELSRLEETEETWQVNVMCDPGLDIGPKKAHSGIIDEIKIKSID